MKCSVKYKSNLLLQVMTLNRSVKLKKWTESKHYNTYFTPFNKITSLPCFTANATMYCTQLKAFVRYRGFHKYSFHMSCLNLMYCTLKWLHIWLNSLLLLKNSIKLNFMFRGFHASAADSLFEDHICGASAVWMATSQKYISLLC
jgi:hypothetical protein